MRAVDRFLLPIACIAFPTRLGNRLAPSSTKERHLLLFTSARNYTNTHLPMQHTQELALTQAPLSTSLTGGPEGIRTPVAGMRARYPRPLDDGTGIRY